LKQTWIPQHFIYRSNPDNLAQLTFHLLPDVPVLIGRRTLPDRLVRVEGWKVSERWANGVVAVVERAGVVGSGRSRERGGENGSVALSRRELEGRRTGRRHWSRNGLGLGGRSRRSSAIDGLERLFRRSLTRFFPVFALRRFREGKGRDLHPSLLPPLRREPKPFSTFSPLTFLHRPRCKVPQSSLAPTTAQRRRKLHPRCVSSEFERADLRKRGRTGEVREGRMAVLKLLC
jgi:hypothetical protein